MISIIMKIKSKLKVMNYNIFLELNIMFQLMTTQETLDLIDQTK